MMIRVTFSILLNLAAVAVPGAVLLHTFGPSAQVDPQSTKDLLYLFGSALFAFAVALMAGSLLKGSDKPAVVSIIEDLFSRAERSVK